MESIIVDSTCIIVLGGGGGGGGGGGPFSAFARITMQIVYCDAAGLRIPNEHITAGRVIVHDNKYICENCVPRTEPQRPGMGSSRKIVLLTSSTPLPPINRSPRGSAAGLTPQPRASSDKPSGRMPHAAAAPQEEADHAAGDRNWLDGARRDRRDCLRR